MPIKFPASQPQNKTFCSKRNIFKLKMGPLGTALPKPHQGLVLFSHSGDVLATSWEQSPSVRDGRKERRRKWIPGCREIPHLYEHHTPCRTQRFPEPPTKEQHTGHTAGSQRSQPWERIPLRRRQRGEKRDRHENNSELLHSAQRSGSHRTQRSGGERQLLPAGHGVPGQLLKFLGARRSRAGEGRNRRGLGGTGGQRAPSRPRSGAGSRAGTGRPRPGGAAGRNRRERGGRVLTYAVLLLPFGGHPAGHGAGSRRDARAPLPTPPFSDRGTGKVSPDGGVMWCGRSQPGPARRPSPALRAPSAPGERPGPAPRLPPTGRAPTQRSWDGEVLLAYPPLYSRCARLCPRCLPASPRLCPRCARLCSPGKFLLVQSRRFWLRPTRRCGFETKFLRMFNSWSRICVWVVPCGSWTSTRSAAVRT